MSIRIHQALTLHIHITIIPVHYYNTFYLYLNITLLLSFIYTERPLMNYWGLFCICLIYSKENGFTVTVDDPGIKYRS